MLKTFAKHFSCIVPILQSVSLCQHELRCCHNFFFPSQRRRKERLAENRTSVARNRKTFKIKRFFFRRKPPFHALIAPLLTSALSFNLRSVLSPSFQLFFLHLLLLPPLSLSLSPSILSSSSCWGCDQSAALFSCTNTTTLQLGASLPLLLLLFLLRTRKCFWLLRDTKFDNNERAFQLASRRSLSKKESVDLRGSLIDFQGFIESNNHFRANMWSRADLILHCSRNQTYKNKNNNVCFHELKSKFKDFLCTQNTYSSQIVRTKL